MPPGPHRQRPHHRRSIAAHDRRGGDGVSHLVRAETVLGITAIFLKEKLGGTIADPFGASLALILFGLFFARPPYRMKQMTPVLGNCGTD